MYTALLAGQQPTDTDFRHQNGLAADTTDTPGEGASDAAQQGFAQQTPNVRQHAGHHQQQQQYEEEQQEQHEHQHDTQDDEDIYSLSDGSSDAGEALDDDVDDGMYDSVEDEGLAEDVPTYSTAAHGTARWYKDHLTDHLWVCNDVCSKLHIHEAIFMLMAWKADNCVRHKAFTALLGMLCELLLPEVRLKAINW